MAIVFLPDLRIHLAEDGTADGPAVVFLHGLGLDGTLFDTVLPHMPSGLRLVRPDLRGHGASDVPPAPYAMGAMIRDVERVMDHLALKDAVVVGVSLGGLIAQGLAVKRLDLVRGVVLSNTAPRIATPAIWADRIAEVRAGGLASVAQAALERWFAKGFRASQPARDLIARYVLADPEGWCGAAAAIAGADFRKVTPGLRLPCLAIAGAHDGSTPPDLMREMASAIPGSRFTLLREAGHLPMVDAPAEWAAEVAGFLHGIGHHA
ncbi:MAG TPA: 3-oxoadipate enol-lactonase [Paracoccaceae bacterium]|nr:3-oxoadipate enol-lactonase [Paracoccaceae bacterium]HMO70747.1 3-oxoadipate enol-lactonase [Paracoccaceae bacterium]